MFVSKNLNTPYFVAKFTNMACEDKMLEKLRPEVDFFMSACVVTVYSAQCTVQCSEGEQDAHSVPLPSSYL